MHTLEAQPRGEISESWSKLAGSTPSSTRSLTSLILPPYLCLQKYLKMCQTKFYQKQNQKDTHKVINNTHFTSNTKTSADIINISRIGAQFDQELDNFDIATLLEDNVLEKSISKCWNKIV